MEDLDNTNLHIEPPSRHDFFREYRAEPVTDNFCKLIFGDRITTPIENDSIDANLACMYLFFSFQSDNIHFFQKVVQAFELRELKPHAPWWLNDLLIFGLVLCSSKYNESGDWILEVLHYRTDNTTGMVRNIGLTFIDVHSGNWNNSSNIRPLSLVSHNLLQPKEANEQLIISAYESIIDEASTSSENRFLEVIGIRAFDIAILNNLPVSGSFRRSSNRLAAATWRVSKLCAWFLWVVASASLICVLIWFVVWSWNLSDNSLGKDTLDYLSRIGVPVLTLLPLSTWFAKSRLIISWLQSRIAFSLFSLDKAVLSL